jgi:hypothetical protein
MFVREVLSDGGIYLLMYLKATYLAAFSMNME